MLSSTRCTIKSALLQSQQLVQGADAARDLHCSLHICSCMFQDKVMSRRRQVRNAVKGNIAIGRQICINCETAEKITACASEWQILVTRGKV